MTCQYRVCPAGSSGLTGGDGAGVLRVWQDNLELVSDPGARYRWLYEEGGAFLGDAGSRSNLVLVAGEEGRERVVGSAGVVPRRVWLAGQERRAGLHIDLAVDASHRTFRPALMLVRAAGAAARERFDLALGFPNEQSLPVFRRVGYQVLGQSVRYARVLRHARYVERVVDVPALGSVGGRILDMASSARRFGSRLRAATTQRLEWVSGFDERFDRLFVSARGEYPLVLDRSAAYLHWRFVREPGGGSEIAVLRWRGRSGALRVYAVVRLRGTTASIRDLFGFPDEVGAFLELLLPALRARGAEVVSFELLAPLWLATLLESLGFRPREEGVAVVLAAREEGMAPEPGAWLLTEADRDT